MKIFRSIAADCGPVLFKDRKSKFFGFAFNVEDLNQVKNKILELKAAYPDSSHICYAYKIGTDRPEIRMNDDGEPAYSAGAPIFGQIEAYELCNILVCVIRYYGGTKLGIGGLIHAYRETTKACLEQSQITNIIPTKILILNFEYAVLDQVMRIISQKQLKITDQKMGLSCAIALKGQENEVDEILKIFTSTPGVSITLN